MKAVCWNGRNEVRVENVPDPKILNPRDAVIRITLTAICGSDLHLYDGYIPTMQKGDILGHEFMGVVEEVGHENGLKKGDRVVVPFAIACGGCFFCKRQLWSLCDNTNPNAELAESMYGYTGAGLFGYSHLYGGYAGGQAQYVRVPYADAGCLKIPEHLSDEQSLFLSDIFPTGYMAAENCNIQPGDTVGVWGCGPVGQFAIRSAFLLGAGRVIAIDRFPERLNMAKAGRGRGTQLRGARRYRRDVEADDGRHGTGFRYRCRGNGSPRGFRSFLYDKAKQAVRLESDRPYALRQAIQACRKGGTVSIPGVYGGLIDKFPLGAAFAKGLTFKMGQTHMHKYMRPLLERIEKGEIDPSFVISHRFNLDDAPVAYEIFKNKEDSCIKCVLNPQ